MAFKKIDIEFCLTDSSVNVYGYRLLTTGLQLKKFRPAIGFLMHSRGGGIAVKWTDFKVEGDRVFAKPNINEKLYPELAEQIEDGFYAAASVGKIVALKMSEEPGDKIEGQTGPTVTEWYPRECSIVDIPGNYNAVTRDLLSVQQAPLPEQKNLYEDEGLRQLYDESDNILMDLSYNINQGKTPQTLDKMDSDIIKLSDLKLPEGTTPDMAVSMFSDLQDKASKLDTAVKELADLKAAQTTEKVAGILEKGKADKKLTVELADKLATDYAGNPQGLQALVDSMPSQTMVTQSLNDGKVPEKYAGKTYQDLYLSGELGEVKKSFPDFYSELKKL
jgi:hypothetical protein